jgi:LuxR family maltose regulon positive regulatory protein
VTLFDSTGRKNPTSLVKITPPLIHNYYARNRIFCLLDESREQPITWITAPAGSGKTTLVSSYVTERRLSCLWYQVDARDDDAATFFYYMSLAAKNAAPGYHKPLPLLTPEYRLGLRTFTRRYFEEVYKRIQGVKESHDNVKIRGKPAAGSPNSRTLEPFLIIFDNYQEVPAISGFHETVRCGMDIIPEGIRVVVISRTVPPEAFARLRANGLMALVGFDELRLTEEETAGIMRLKAKKSFTKNCVKSVHGRTHGWTAGLVLLLEKLRQGEADHGSCQEGETEIVFDYFASEIFQKAESDTQDFLLKTAFFPFMDVQMADRVAATNNAGRILSDLVRNNYFTERRDQSHPAYQYHPLFREFLVSRARGFFSADEISRLQQQTASVLEEAGNAEDAVNLYRSASDHKEVMRLTITHAPLFVAEGRSRVIGEWIMSIPKEMQENAPWLLYWLGICRMPFNAQESERCLERAFNGFRLNKDALGTYLSWSGIIECSFTGWRDFCHLDKWIDVIGEVMREHPSFPEAEVEARVSGGLLFALAARRPDHPAINDWADRLDALLPQITNTYLKITLFSYLSTHYLWRGDIGKLRRQITLMNNELQLMAHSASPAYSLMLIYSKQLEATCLYLAAEPEQAMRRLTEAFEIADSSGIHVWDFVLLGQAVSAAFCSSDFAVAEDFLKRMMSFSHKASNYCISYYDHQNAWYHFLRGNDKEALLHGEESLRHAIASGNAFADMGSHIAMANVLFKAGEHQRALHLLAHALQVSRRMNSKMGEFMALISEAHFALEMGHEERCLDALRSAFSLGRETTIMHFLFWIPSRMSRLCAEALENGIETEYVRKLIKKRGIVPDDRRLYIESWPYPVKIYTLGRFGILRDDKPISSSGKVQKKPIEMLKILVALGGKKVREEQLADLLWPEAEGDAAHSSFKMTLSRLRQLLGNENIIRLHEGQITLDQRYYWVDAWAFQRIVNQAEALMPGIGERNGKREKRRRDLEEIARLTEKAISLYKGHFLSDDKDQIWTLFLRERLRSKVTSLISKTGQCCEQWGHFEKAAEYYRKGLEADNLSEEFCQRLMECYRKLGRRAEAISLYAHFTKTTEALLGITPSKKTETIYRSLKEN